MPAPELRTVSVLGQVFISYAQDDDYHRQKVIEFWQFLRACGIDAQLDHSYEGDPQDWPSWMVRQIRAARFVLVIASPGYIERADGDPRRGEGRGVKFEAGLLRDEVYRNRESALGRFLPVVLPGRTRDEIPVWLGGGASTYYTVDSCTEEGAWYLLRTLRGATSADLLPPLGTIAGHGNSVPKSALPFLMRRMTNRDVDRNDAMVQADVRQFLLLADLGLDEADLGVALGDSPHLQHKIHIRIARTVIEVRGNLRGPGVAQSALEGLSEYCATQARSIGGYYAAILTDGAEWHLYLSDGHDLQHIHTWQSETTIPGPNSLGAWLESILSSRINVKPSPSEILRRLGASSPFYAFSTAVVAGMYRSCRSDPNVKVRRRLWSRLLTTAQGTNFSDDDTLFIDHTLLVTMAKVIGHIVLDYDLRSSAVAAKDIMSGAKFAEAGIGGAVEADFFDWISAAPGGSEFVADLVRKLTRFSWDEVEHDVMKVLYQSIIRPEVRHKLGEYYTPDWLAEIITRECVPTPLEARILDPSCGSGTFLFHAVRRYLAASDAEGCESGALVPSLVDHIIGIDVNPVAVTLARITYLLAIGSERLRARNRMPFDVPVYLGDSLRWGQETTLLSHDGLSVSTRDDGEFVSADFGSGESLEFPEELVADVSRFDPLINELANRATRRRRGSPVPRLTATFEKFDVSARHQSTLEHTFAQMCRLHDEERDHIWGYYVRNFARPIWLARSDNRVDVIIGNPPWLAFRYMTASQQRIFREMSIERSLWSGAVAASHQDLSALFAVRCIELYLKPGGTFGYVMPWGALSRRAYSGFRSGNYPVTAEPVRVQFSRAWDLHSVKPSFFPVPASVVMGQRASSIGRALPLQEPYEIWSGQLSTDPQIPSPVSLSRTLQDRTPAAPSLRSYYATQFFQGATIVPRFLFFVDPGELNPLGSGAGRRVVRSRRSANEKKPWKDLESHQGVVEEIFIRRVLLGDCILPYRCLSPSEAVIPWDTDRHRLLDGEDDWLDLYDGLSQWWNHAEAVWNSHRSSDRLSLRERLDYQRGLSRQFPIEPYRVVYSKSGMYMAASIVQGPEVLIDHKLYWAAVTDLDEARYLTAVLNSPIITMATRPLQARGEHNPRDFDKYVLSLPIPRFDERNRRHQDLVSLSSTMELIAAETPLYSVRFEAQRRLVRERLAAAPEANMIDRIVGSLIG